MLAISLPSYWKCSCQHLIIIFHNSIILFIFTIGQHQWQKTKIKNDLKERPKVGFFWSENDCETIFSILLLSFSCIQQFCYHESIWCFPTFIPKNCPPFQSMLLVGAFIIFGLKFCLCEEVNKLGYNGYVNSSYVVSRVCPY